MDAYSRSTVSSWGMKGFIILVTRSFDKKLRMTYRNLWSDYFIFCIFMELSSSEKALYYSLDPDLWIKQLRIWETEQVYDTATLAQWMKEQWVSWQLADLEGYHFKFHRVPSKPYIIYYQGNIDILNQSILWMVGPRKVSNYAKQVMEDIFGAIKEYQIATISGGAPGIDTICHEYSLEHNIPTIMVLGAWLGYYLQHQQRHLMKRIIDAWWLVLSEFKLKQKPTNYTFPQRNRIVAWLSDAVFIPAAGKKSGTLITVDAALQIHTKVYSVPASIYDDTSAGSNEYIAVGKIKAVSDFHQFLHHHFDKKYLWKKQIPPERNLSPVQRDIIDFLRQQGEQTIENIADGLGKPLNDMMSEITLLEMQWWVYEMKPWVYGIK